LHPIVDDPWRRDHYDGAYRPGAYLGDREVGEVVPQFFHLHPMLLAVGGATFGPERATFVLPWLAALWLACLACCARRLWPRGAWAVLAVALVVGSPLAIWTARTPLSENPMALFEWTAVLVALRLRDAAERERVGGCLIAACLGLCALTRGNALLLLPLVLALAWLRPRGTTANEDGATQATYLLLGSLLASIVMHAATTYPYMHDELLRQLPRARLGPLELVGVAGGVEGTILIIEDVTDRVRLEEQLQISEKMASIGVLAACVAHEVNTPLTGISSFTQMLLEGADRGDPRTALLEKIERQTFRAAKIVNGLLTLSRPGTPGTDRTIVDLNVVVADVFSLLEHQLAASRITVRRELSPVPVAVLGIEHQLQQVFLNLFLNARDAMPSGGWLSVVTRAEADGVVAEVADTGTGIPPEQLSRIYDPFFTTKTIGRGTGLGLSITYGIVREHDGAVRCDSAIGKGTRFTLTFPPVPAQAARTAVQ
jgi:signal transduction histidine kinase